MPSETNIVDRQTIISERIERNKGRQRASDKTPPLTIVSYDWESTDKIQSTRMPTGFLRSVLFMGMITNMPGHCLVIDRDGVGHWGCHPESFFVLSEEDT